MINDSPELLAVLGEVLGYRGADVQLLHGCTTTDPIRTFSPDVLFVDLRLSGKSLAGWEVVTLIRRDDRLSRLPIIVCSSTPRDLRDRSLEVARDPNTRVLTLPFSVDDFESAVDEALSRRMTLPKA